MNSCVQERGILICEPGTFGIQVKPDKPNDPRLQPEGYHQGRGDAVPLQELPLLPGRPPLPGFSIHEHGLILQDPHNPPGEIAREKLLELPTVRLLRRHAPLVRGPEQRPGIVEKREIGSACPARAAKILERIIDCLIDLCGVHETCGHCSDGKLEIAAVTGCTLCRPLYYGSVEAGKKEPGIGGLWLMYGADRDLGIKKG